MSFMQSRLLVKSALVRVASDMAMYLADGTFATVHISLEEADSFIVPVRSVGTAHLGYVEGLIVPKSLVQKRGCYVKVLHVKSKVNVESKQ